MTAYSLFGTTTPATINANDGPLALGTVVQITGNGTITHIKLYFSNPLPSGTVTWYCADLSTHTLLGSQAFTSPTTGWVQQALVTPITITGGRNVLVWAGTPGGYVFTNGFFTAAATTSGPLTAPRSVNDPEGIGNGRFGGTPSSYPAATSGATCYFTDLVFNDAQATGSASLTLSYTFAVTGAAVDPPVVPAVANGWYGLMGILEAARDDAAALAGVPPVACPHDGEPLITNVNGVLFCPYDGWRPGRA